VAAIEFRNIRVEPGRLDIDCTEWVDSVRREIGLWFTFEEFVPAPDRIAVVLAALCGRAYDHLTFDLALTPRVIGELGSFTHAEITCDEAAAVAEDPPGGGVILSFSGGFDSLAALGLLGESCVPLSTDWGSWHDREAESFGGFSPRLLRTNVRRALATDRNSWTFMGCGAILYAGYLGCSGLVFGTVMEDSFGAVRRGKPLATSRVPPFDSVGLTNYRVVHALTEVGTAMCCEAFYPELVQRSLASVGAAGSTKRYRKELLVEAIRSRHGRPSGVPPEFHPPARPLAWGESIVDDFVCFYLLPEVGELAVARLVSGVPAVVPSLAGRLDLTLYERVMPDLVTLPPTLDESAYYAKLGRAGITPWTDDDWAEFESIVEVLRDFHPVPVRF
jgi:cyanophycin synthetase